MGMDAGQGSSGDRAAETADLARRHVRVGWIGLAAFAALGLSLEGMHALKIDWYLSELTAMRRLMLTLAHAHGTLIAVLHLALGLVLAGPWADGPAPWLAARLLSAALLLMPAGFLLGGLYVYEGDPGVGVALAPLGGLCLLAALVGLAAHRAAPGRSRTADPDAQVGPRRRVPPKRRRGR